VSKIFKYITVLLLWVAGLSLSAHLIIPHDHHSADIIIDQDENCPSSDNESNHRSGLPLHCHAFNDLTSERIRTFQISENIQFTIFMLSKPTDNSVGISSSSYNYFAELSKPFIDSFNLEFSSLRAPPASA